MITNSQTGTNINEVAPGIYRINTPVDLPGGLGFNFNQYLIVDDESLLFHKGPRGMFRLVSHAIAQVIDFSRLRYIGLSHVEADECGAMNELLAAAPNASPLCGRIAALVSMNDLADRPPRMMADGELLELGTHTIRWFDTPHLPHGWESGLMMDTQTRTLFCGDLFTQPSSGEKALTQTSILESSEAFHKTMDYFAHAPTTATTLARLAAEEPNTLACMHGSAWQGDGEALLRQLAHELVGAN